MAHFVFTSVLWVSFYLCLPIVSVYSAAKSGQKQSARVARSTRGQLPRHRPRFSSNWFFKVGFGCIANLYEIYIYHCASCCGQDREGILIMFWLGLPEHCLKNLFEFCKRIPNSRLSAWFLSWPRPALQPTYLWTFPKALRWPSGFAGIPLDMLHQVVFPSRWYHICQDIILSWFNHHSLFLAPAYHPEPSYGHPKGRVGPVYTFVKTDPKVMSWIILSTVCYPKLVTRGSVLVCFTSP